MIVGTVIIALSFGDTVQIKQDSQKAVCEIFASRFSLLFSMYFFVLQRCVARQAFKGFGEIVRCVERQFFRDFRDG